MPWLLLHSFNIVDDFFYIFTSTFTRAEVNSFHQKSVYIIYIEYPVSEVELLVKTVNGWKPLTSVVKIFLLDVWTDLEYASVISTFVLSITRIVLLNSLKLVLLVTGNNNNFYMLCICLFIVDCVDAKKK